MYMVKSPQGDFRLITYRDTPVDLQPAKYYMQIGRIFHIAIYPGILLDLPEPSIEKKNVAIYYILVLEMPFCCFCLPKNGFPSRLPGNTSRNQIRVEMYKLARIDFLLCQITDKVPQIQMAKLYLFITLQMTTRS